MISNETPYSAALRCMAGYTAQRPIRIAVGQIADYTGKSESDNSGRKITQGAALMAMSGLSKAGVRLVERFDTSVAEMELKYANNRLIGADGATPAGGADYRQIIAGSIPGSDYYLVGGITELNFNIRSVGASADGGETATNGLKGQTGGNMYVMNVGLDLRLVDTKTLQVVDVISYQKQIIGHQVSVGVFDFLGSNFFDASIGQSALEPIQLAVRSVIERAVLEMTSRLYHTSGNCAATTDPLASADDRAPAPAAYSPYGQPITARNEDHNYDRLAKILIASTVLAILPQMACAAASEATATSTSTGSSSTVAGTSTGGETNILNGQISLGVQWSTVTTTVSGAGGDVVIQGTGAGNAVDITTFNDTHVTSTQNADQRRDRFDRQCQCQRRLGRGQHLGPGFCNSTSVSTDPAVTEVHSDQTCRADDPASEVYANVNNVAGDVSIASSAFGNTYLEDTNALNAPARSTRTTSPTCSAR